MQYITPDGKLVERGPAQNQSPQQELYIRPNGEVISMRPAAVVNTSHEPRFMPITPYYADGVAGNAEASPPPAEMAVQSAPEGTALRHAWAYLRAPR